MAFKLKMRLFDRNSVSFPTLDVSQVEMSQSTCCTCPELLKMQLGPGIGAHQMDVEFLCHSNSNLKLAIQAHEFFLESATTGTVSVLAQRDLLFRIREFCQCQTPSDQILTYEADELQVNSLRTPEQWSSCQSLVSLDSESSTSSPETPALRSISAGGLFRVAPEVLKLRKNERRAITRKKINKKLMDLIRQPLTKQSHEKSKSPLGYIYLMAVTSNAGFVKIGFSGRKPGMRERQLEECFEGIQIVCNTKHAIPHAQRVERLVHSELTEQRRWMDCDSCGKEHREWFEVSSELAEQAILRWSAWMASDPYDSKGNLRKRWEDRLTEKLVRQLVPAVDHFENSDSWQRWTDLRRPDECEDKSHQVEIVRNDREPSPWGVR